MNKKKVEQFINQAEEQKLMRGKVALRGADKFLQTQRWIESCEGLTIDYYNMFYNNLERALSHLILYSDERRTPMLDFLLNSDTDRYFPTINPASASLPELSAIIKFSLARTFLFIISERRIPLDLEERFRAALRLDSEPGADDTAIEEDRAYECILMLACGHHDEIITKYEKNYRFDLSKLHNARMTITKQCCILSQIDCNRTDDNLRFGESCHIAILKLGYYKWLVESTEKARIGIVPLAAMYYLRTKILSGRTPSDLEFARAMQPRAIAEELSALGVPW